MGKGMHAAASDNGCGVMDENNEGLLAWNCSFEILVDYVLV